MSKIFVLSLHRSATQSVDELFLRAGLSAMHGVPTLFDGIDWEQEIAGREDDIGFVAQTLAPVFRNFDAATDLPTPVLYRELERGNPDARFFAIRRRPEDWVRSIRRSLGDRPLSAFSRVLYWHYLPGRPERLTDVSDAELIEMHRQHHQAISRHFSGKPTFALFDLDEPQLGERICTFLGLCPVELFTACSAYELALGALSAALQTKHEDIAWTQALDHAMPRRAAGGDRSIRSVAKFAPRNLAATMWADF
jgi:Sulfotransferase domain